MTDYHRLTRAQFDALASGTGDPEAIAVLRAGQASKHIVMLFVILDRAREMHPDAWSQLNQSYELLLLARRTAPKAVAKLLGHPQVGLWATRCLRQLNGNPSSHTQPIEIELGNLGAIAAVAGMAAGLAFEATVPLRDGTIMLPTLGLARLAAEGSVGQARIVHQPGTLEIRFGEQIVVVPSNPQSDGPGWLGLRRLTSTSNGFTITVELADLGPARDGSERTALSRLSEQVVSGWRKTFDGAWQILTRDHPTEAAMLNAGLVGIIPIGVQGGNKAIFSATTRDAFGYMESDLGSDPLAFAETLVHEFRHSMLYGIADLFPLHDDNGEEIHFAPWRQDPRPIPGLMQGTYAFLGVTAFWRVQQHALNGPRLQRAYFEFARWRHQLAEAIEELIGSGRLTPVGVHLVERMRETLVSWRDEAVPEGIQRLADQAVAAHRVVWRLANVRPDIGTISGLADAWLAGMPCPADVAEVPRTIQSDGVVRKDERLRLTQLRLDDHDRFKAFCDDAQTRAVAGFNEVIDADIAYLHDDFVSAERGYRAAIAIRSDRYQYWSGLAVSRRAVRDDAVSDILLKVPEVVYAIYREVVSRGYEAPDPLALAAWLKPAWVSRVTTTVSAISATVI